MAAFVFADHMVLQQDAPLTIFGFGAAASAAVGVSLGDARGSSTADAGGAWSVALPQMPRGGPFNLSAASGGVTQVVVDVWLGLVFLCSGQSNNSGDNTPVSYVWNATQLIAQSSNFSQVRLLREQTGKSKGSPVPLRELALAPAIPWSVAGPSTVPGFSAVCWLTGKNIAAALGPAQPIGLVEAAMGGTCQQTWLPPEALTPCAPTPPGSGHASESSYLFNSMIAPLLSFRLAGFVWCEFGERPSAAPRAPRASRALHLSDRGSPIILCLPSDQGECNALADPPPFDSWYSCALAHLVSSWRARFASPSAWFGVVQLSTWSSNGPEDNEMVAVARDVQLRAAPEAGLAHVTTASGVDGGDPTGTVHTRCKLDLGKRLAAGALLDLFGLGAPGDAMGPVFASSAVGGGAAGLMSVTVRFAPPFDAAGSLRLVAPGADDGQLCSSPSNVSTACPTGIPSALCVGFQLQDAASGAWWNATAALSAAGDALVLTAVGAPAGAAANATSSGWGLWPISLLYGAEGNAPAFPWRRAISAA